MGLLRGEFGHAREAVGWLRVMRPGSAAGVAQRLLRSADVAALASEAWGPAAAAAAAVRCGDSSSESDSEWSETEDL